MMAMTTTTMMMMVEMMVMASDTFELMIANLYAMLPGARPPRIAMKTIMVFGIVTLQGWTDLHTTQACRYHLMCKMCTSASIPAALHSLIAKMSCLATIQV